MPIIVTQTYSNFVIGEFKLTENGEKYEMRFMKELKRLKVRTVS